MYFYSICCVYYDSSDGAASSRRLPTFLCVIATCVDSTACCHDGPHAPGNFRPGGASNLHPTDGATGGSDRASGPPVGKWLGTTPRRPVARQRPNCIIGSNATCPAWTPTWVAQCYPSAWTPTLIAQCYPQKPLRCDACAKFKMATPHGRRQPLGSRLEDAW